MEPLIISKNQRVFLDKVVEDSKTGKFSIERFLDAYFYNRISSVELEGLVDYLGVENLLRALVTKKYTDGIFEVGEVVYDLHSEKYVVVERVTVERENTNIIPYEYHLTVPLKSKVIVKDSNHSGRSYQRDSRSLKHITKEEEVKFLLWDDNNRGVWELKKGDVLIDDKTGILSSVTKVAPNTEDVDNVTYRRFDYPSSGNTIPITHIKKIFKVFCFVENRVDWRLFQ